MLPLSPFFRLLRNFTVTMLLTMSEADPNKMSEGLED